MRVALLFIDGVGIGPPDPAVNPLARDQYLLSCFLSPQGPRGNPLPGGGVLIPLDPTFGLLGRPQSATNQTAILTGEPAPVLLGRHLLGYPNPFLRGLIKERSIVKRLVQAGKTAAFANCYPPGYLKALGLPSPEGAAAEVSIPLRIAQKLRPSATTLAFTAAGLALGTLEQARAGRGLTPDIDGRTAQARGLSVPLRSAEAAAEVFWRIAGEADFTLFEHFLADEAGHAQDFEAAAQALGTFDRFARAVVGARPPDACVLICSDHGNVEDLSTRGHTRNPVAALAFGPPRGLRPGGTVDEVGRAVLQTLGVDEVAPSRAAGR